LSLSLREEHRLRVFGNGVLRKIFGPKREDVAGGYIRLHNEELHNLYASQNIGVVKSRRMQWAGQVVRVGEIRNAYKILVGNLKGKDHSKDLGVDGRIILEWTLGKYDGKIWTGCIYLVQDRDQWWALVNTVINLSVP
jgi:hypothetical protein